MVTEYTEICVFCGRPKECTHHLIFGNGLHKLADQDGLTIPMCNRCHNMGLIIDRIHENPAAETLSKIAGQLAWEKEYIADRLELPFGDIRQEARDAFMERYGRSYL